MTPLTRRAKLLALIGALTVAKTAPAQQMTVTRTRILGAKLLYDPAVKGWKITAQAKNVEVFVNGLHYWQGTDYTIAAGVIRSLSFNMPPDADVRVLYDIG